MAMPSGPTVLPFKSEKLSFSLSYKNDAATNAQVELACLCFDREGQVLDYIQFNRRAALNSSLKHSNCSHLPPADAVQADEAIHMYPFDFAPQCEVMLLLASAPKHGLQHNDLGSSGKLQFQVHAREMGKEQLRLLDVDLSLFVRHNTKAAGPLSNGHQTMVIAGIYTNPQGWTLSFDCTTFAEDHWGRLLPELRNLLRRWPTLSAAENAHKQPHQTVICSRKGEDHLMAALAAQLWPDGATHASTMAGDHGEDSSSPAVVGDLANGTSSVAAAITEGSLGEQQAAGSSSTAAAAAAAVGTSKLVLEIGWQVFRPIPTEEDEEEDPPMVDFNLTLYNLQGEEIASINPDSIECEGVVCDEEEPDLQEPEAEEASVPTEAEPPQGDQEDKEAGSKAAAAHEGEEGDEHIPVEENEETKAAKAAAAAEAAAAAAQRAAANQRPLGKRFPLKRKVHLSMPELPPETHAMLLTLSNFGGGGFKNVESLHARLVLEDPRQQQQQKDGQSDETAEEGDEPSMAKKREPRQPPRVLVHYRFDSVQGADEHLTQLLMLKLYKEYPDSAFAVWQQQQVPDVTALMDNKAAPDAVTDGGQSTCGAPERAKEVLQLVLATRKQLEKDLADLRAKAEEEGLDEEEAEPDIRLDRGLWRVRVLGVTAGGAEPEALTDTINSLLAYDGDIDASGQRSSKAAKVTFPNRDTYFGGYAADAKAGMGLYVFANGGSYIGQYASGKRHGPGLMIMPDGGLYRGAFVSDKFEGQGTYLYPDNSYYTGSWKSGKKHGHGTYWDTTAGCLRGEWAAGALKGQGQYDQPNYHFEGVFAKGMPAGPCTFTINAYRLADLPQPAASYTIAPYGPTLCGEGQYMVPPGAADGPEDLIDDGEPIDPDADKPLMPVWPEYKGLKYKSAASRPCSKPDVPFPPPAAAVAAI